MQLRIQGSAALNARRPRQFNLFGLAAAHSTDPLPPPPPPPPPFVLMPIAKRSFLPTQTELRSLFALSVDNGLERRVINRGSEERDEREKKKKKTIEAN